MKLKAGNSFCFVILKECCHPFLMDVIIIIIIRLLVSFCSTSLLVVVVFFLIFLLQYITFAWLKGQKSLFSSAAVALQNIGKT